MEFSTLALYLVATFGCGLAARMVRLPPMVGFLAAGFGLHAMDAPRLAGIDVIADLGVTLLLFGIGLKLDVRTLVRREVWLTAVTHMAVSVAAAVGVLALLATAGFALLVEETPTSLVLLGFALSFSSTVFVVKVLEDRSDATTLYGRVAIGILVLQDLAAVAFLAASEKAPPSWWALTLVGLPLATWLLGRLWSRIGHGELHVLFGVMMALVPGYALFDAVGLKGDLGALAIGALLASHPSASELSRTLWSLKELLLVGFFVSIGLSGSVSMEGAVLAVLLLVLLPLQGVLYLVLLSALGLRHRSSVLASLSLANFSEFGLIVAAVGTSAGWVQGEWLPVLALAVALSFLLCALANGPATNLAAWVEDRLPDQDPERLVPSDRPIDVGDAHALVLGMGRVGRAAFERLRDEMGHAVLGVEHDDTRVAHLRDTGFEVVRADATDQEFWLRVSRASEVTIAVLAMPFHGSNLKALELLRECGFEGRVAAVAQYDDDAAELERLGANAVFHLYGGAGTALADSVAGDAGDAG